MKRIAFLLLSLYIMACNSGMESDTLKKAEASEVEETVAADDNFSEDLPVMSEVGMNYSEIVTQKLQEYADLRSLIQKHPEFKTDLQSQMTAISTDSLLLRVLGDSIVITNIDQIGNAKVISDTVKHIPFSFIVNSPNAFRKDSLIAVFTTRKVEIDGQIFISNKVTFDSFGE